MESNCFDVSIENNIAHIVLNRPDKRNSMIPEFWDDLPRIVNQIDKESLARVIVISSTGTHFSAGMDLSVFSQSNITGRDEKSNNEKGRFRGSFYKNLLKLIKTRRSRRSGPGPPPAPTALLKGECIFRLLYYHSFLIILLSFCWLTR